MSTNKTKNNIDNGFDLTVDYVNHLGCDWLPMIYEIGGIGLKEVARQLWRVYGYTAQEILIKTQDNGAFLDAEMVWPLMVLKQVCEAIDKASTNKPSVTIVKKIEP